MRSPLYDPDMCRPLFAYWASGGSPRAARAPHREAICRRALRRAGGGCRAGADGLARRPRPGFERPGLRGRGAERVAPAPERRPGRTPAGRDAVAAVARPGPPPSDRPPTHRCAAWLGGSPDPQSPRGRRRNAAPGAARAGDRRVGWAASLGPGGVVRALEPAVCRIAPATGAARALCRGRAHGDRRPPRAVPPLRSRHPCLATGAPRPPDPAAGVAAAGLGAPGGPPRALAPRCGAAPSAAADQLSLRPRSPGWQKARDSVDGLQRAGPRNLC
jgi:hypothetical protein